MSVSIWITERECFPTVLMSWIQISNHVCSWLSGRSSNIKQYVFLLTWTIILSLLYSWLVISFRCVSAYELLSIWITKREYFPNVLMSWIQKSNHCCFWLSGTFSNIKWKVLFILEPWFCHCCEAVLKLVFDVNSIHTSQTTLNHNIFTSSPKRFF